MINKLTTPDYKSILQFYNVTIPKNNKLLKKQAEDILAEKLCTCIKKVASTSIKESRAIGICTKTILNRKGLTRGNFTCKKNQSISEIGKKKKYKTLNIRKKTKKQKTKKNKNEN